MTKPTIKVVRNIWGNYVCFVGKERITDYGQEFDAKCWLAEKIMSGKYKVSPKSEWQESEVEEYKKFVG